jgi:hypothetical protein
MVLGHDRGQLGQLALGKKLPGSKKHQVPAACRICGKIAKLRDLYASLR